MFWVHGISLARLASGIRAERALVTYACPLRKYYVTQTSGLAASPPRLPKRYYLSYSPASPPALHGYERTEISTMGHLYSGSSAKYRVIIAILRFVF